MPIKRGSGGAGGEDRGDLYVTIEVEFPTHGALGHIVPIAPRAVDASREGGDDNAGKAQLLRLLRQTESESAPSRNLIEAEVVDEVEYDDTASLDTFGIGGAHGGGGEDEWSDADDDDEGDDDETGQTQCATQ